MFIYDSLTKKEKELPKKETIYMYVCGLTPYDHAHLGHARTYVAFDVLKRYLMYKGYNIFHIQNITDVDDKILKRAKETGENPIELATKFHNEALELFDKLNILRADVYPRVSEHINDIINLINKIIENGYAYETPTGIYFNVERFKDYGKLSGQKIEEIKKKHRIEPDKTKKSPIDFALWKKTKKGEEPVGWESPFGYGRPGWHIECSAMSLKYTGGNTIDIHGGARDLIFPHHENEIAQSEAATGRKFVDLWIHTGFLTVNGVKMSKSLGNFITLKDALSQYDPMALRLFFVSTKYNSPVDFSSRAVEQAKNSLKRIKEAMVFIKNNEENPNINPKLRKSIAENRKKFFEALENDFDTPKALSFLFSSINELFRNQENLDRAALQIAKLLINEFQFIFGIRVETKEISTREDMIIRAVIDVRNELRKEKRYELADKIRQRLKEAGINLKDKGKETEYSLD